MSAKLQAWPKNQKVHNSFESHDPMHWYGKHRGQRICRHGTNNSTASLNRIRLYQVQIIGPNQCCTCIIGMSVATWVYSIDMSICIEKDRSRVWLDETVFHCIPILQLTMVVNSYVPTIHIHQPHIKLGFEKVIVNFTSVWNIFVSLVTCKITPQITSWIWKETHWIVGFPDYNILIIVYGAFPKPYFIRTIWFTLKCKLAYNCRTPKL
jgi:hypothetical protein